MAKISKKTEIEEIIIQDNVVFIHTSDGDYECNLFELTERLEKELGTAVINDDYNLYEIQYSKHWVDKSENSEDESEKVEIEMIVIREALNYIELKQTEKF